MNQKPCSTGEAICCTCWKDLDLQLLDVILMYQQMRDKLFKKMQSLRMVVARFIFS